MKNKLKHLNKRTTIAVTLAITLIFLTGLLTGLATSAPTTYTISGGIAPGASSYSIWVEGTTYYAKTAFGVLTSSTNYSYLIQTCINSLATTGGIISHSKGTYIADSNITINYPCITITGEGGLEGNDPVLSSDYGTMIQIDSHFPHDVFVINSGGLLYVTDVKITNLLIDGVTNETGDYCGIRSFGRYVTIDHVEVTHMGTGIYLANSSYYSCGDSWIQNTITRNCTYEGIKITSNDNQLSNVFSHNCQTGIWLKYPSGGILGNNIHLWGNDGDGLKIEYSINDYFTNLESETNGGYGIFIALLDDGHTVNEKFVNPWVFANGLGGVYIGGNDGYQIHNTLFLGGRIDGHITIATGSINTTFSNVDLSNHGTITTTGSTYTSIKNNVGYITESGGSVANCKNGTWVAHGLAGDPGTTGSITLALRGPSAFNATFILRVPTVLSSNATHFLLEFLAWETAGWTLTPVTTAEQQTIWWDATYKP